MHLPLQITVRHMGYIRQRLGARPQRVRRSWRILRRAFAASWSGQRRQGRSFNVRLAVRVPGHELIVNRDHDEDVYVALRDAFASLTRRLEDVARRQHRQVKTHESTN